MLFISVFSGLNNDTDHTIRRKRYEIQFAANRIFMVPGFCFCDDGHCFYCCDNVYK